MSSPWGKISAPEPVNLKDIMSEEVAKDLQAKEDKKYAEATCVDSQEHCYEVPPEVLEEVAADGTDTDAAIAMMLQKQFDKEYDEILKRTEAKYNGDSKVSLSFENYRRAPQNLDFDSDSEDDEIEDVIDRKNWDRFDAVNKTLNSIPPCGYLMKDGNMITKHNIALSGNKNSCKLMSFPPEFHTGDGAGFEFQLSNKVFNSLKLYSNHEQARRHKLRDKKEDHATAEFGLDEKTRLLIYKMINKQVLERVNGIISIGKEAVILHADRDKSASKPTVQKDCVIKVFKTTLAEFKQREKYIKDDYRFRDRIGKQPIRKSIHLWAEKETANLMRLQKAGIPCPEVIMLKKHVLVMSFIGKDNVPAPKLKEAILSDEEYLLAYNQVIETMKTLYSEANLIHADLSEYNILWYDDKCYFIDVSQALEPSHTDAFYFLLRDCSNIINFFSKKGVPSTHTPEELFATITGCDFQDNIALDALRNSFKVKPHLIGKPGMEPHDCFDAAWKKFNEKEVDESIDEKFDRLVEPVTA